ncbi:MAG TPA: helix-turn-helix domain-containing protein [Chitinophagaceae bacterium]|nr:helix-turn-helix domain-containing protein [Chitinophagaceae bacterium]
MGGVTVDEKALGKRLQLARKRAGLTQQELCQKAGLSYSTLAKIERGAIRSPSVFTVANIAAATQTTIEDLLDMAARGDSPAPAVTKKRSKTGVTFVYFDVNDTLVRFFHKAFAEIAQISGHPSDMVETLFWRYHDGPATGKTSVDDFNAALSKELGLPTLDWHKYYMDNVEPMPGIADLVDWAAENYEIGLLSNNLPGFIDEMCQNGKIPNAGYKAIVDSSKVGLLKPDPKIFEAAQQLAAVESREILLVDNDRPNLIAADRLGWQVVWFDDLDPAGSIGRVKESLAF